MTNLLTASDVATLLAVSVKTVYAWTHQEFIPHYKFGKSTRFAPDEIQEWAAKRKVSGRPSRLKPVY